MTPEQKYKEAFETLYSLCEQNGWTVKASAQSPIKGGDGNVEYIMHFQS